MNSIIKTCYIMAILHTLTIISGPGEENRQSTDGIHIDDDHTKMIHTEQEKAITSRQKKERKEVKNKAKIDGKVVKRSMEYKQLKLQHSSEIIAYHEIKFQQSLVGDALKTAKAIETNFDSLKRYQNKYKLDILENSLRQAVSRINKAYNKAHQALTQATNLHARVYCPEAATLLDSAQQDFSQISHLKRNIEDFYEKIAQEVVFKHVESSSSVSSSDLNSSPRETDSQDISQKSDAEESPIKNNSLEI